MAIGNKLKQLLDDRGITIKDFAQKIGVPPTTLYSFIKRDSQNAKMDLIAKICDGLDISVRDLLTSQEEIEINGEITKPIDLTCFDTPEQINIALGAIIPNMQDSIRREEYYKRLSFYDDIDTLQSELLDNFQYLNEKGRKEAVKRVQELTEIPRYTEPDPNTSNEDPEEN